MKTNISTANGVFNKMSVLACMVISTCASSLLSAAPATVPAGLVGWWTGDGTGADWTSNNNGVLQGGISFAAGEVGLGFVLVQSNDFVSIPANANLNVGTGTGMSIELWVNPAVITGTIPLVEWNNGTNWGAHFFIVNSQLYANLVDTSTTWHSVTAPGYMQSNVFQHVAITYDKTSGRVQLYQNGTLAADQYVGGITPQTSYNLYLGRRPAYFQSSLKGMLDEVSLYNRALTAAEIQAIYLSGAEGKQKAPVAPQILQQPQNQSSFYSSNAAFSVTAAGSFPLAYQWYFNTNAIADATNATLVLTGLATNQAGGYYVVVTNSVGAVTSTTAILTLQTAPLPNYDLSRDYSTNANPSGVWAYGWKNTVTGSFSNYLYYRVVSSSSGTPEQVWARFSNTGGSVERNGSTTTVAVAIYDQAHYEPLQVIQCAGNNSEIDNFSVVRFTVPNGGAGNYQVLASARSAVNGSASGDADFHVVLNTTELLSNNIPASSVSITNGTGYTNLLILQAGDTLDFLSGRGIDNDINGSVLKVQVQIQLANTNPVPPQITAQPMDQSSYYGSSASFSVIAAGSSPLVYQWYSNNVPVWDGTNTSLTITNCQIQQHANTFFVVITNSSGVVTSRVATLSVSPVTPNLVSWWTGDGSGADLRGQNHGFHQGGISFGPGKVADGFVLTATNDCILVPASPSLNVGLANGLSIELWIKPTVANATIPLLEWNNGTNWGAHLFIFGSAQLYANLVDTGRTSHSLSSSSGLIQSNVFQHVALTYSKTNGMAQLYHNGILVAEQNLGSFVPQTSHNLYLGRRPAPANEIMNFTGMLDEVSLYNRALTSTEIQAIYLLGADGKQKSPSPLVAPQVLRQPQNQIVVSSLNARFDVVSAGTAPLAYQWYSNSIPIPDGTNYSLLVMNCQTQQSGSAFSAVITNALGSTTSLVATLTVIPPTPPSITLNPTSKVVLAGSGVAFSASATGSAPLFYQWYFNSSPLPLATNLTLSLTNLAPEQAGNYYAVVTNMAGIANSATATLAVVVLPNTFFDDFDPTLETLQWSVLGGTVIATNYGGAISGSNALWFGGSGTRYAATRNLQTVAGGNISFYLRYADGTTLSKWYKPTLPSEGVVVEYSTNNGSAWTLIADCSSNITLGVWTNIQLAIPAGACTMSTQFRWKQKTYSSSSYDHWVLDNVTVTPNDIAPRILTQPTNQTVYSGFPATLSVVCAGISPLSYQWFFGPTVIPEETNATLVINAANGTFSGNYTVVITNAWGAVTSSPALLSVLPPPSQLRIPNVSGNPGETLIVPVQLVSRSNENSASFTLAFDPLKLTYASAQLSGGLSGAFRAINSLQAGNGLVGFSVYLSPDQTFALGTQEVFQVTFNVNVATQAATTVISFTNVPTPLMVIDSLGQVLPLVCSNSTVSIAACELEGDVFPLGSGNKAVNIQDQVFVGRMVAGLTLPTNDLEFQRADCAPSETRGDGRVTVTDWVQAGRYAIGLDVAQAAGGPLNAVTGSLAMVAHASETFAYETAGAERKLFVENNLLQAGQTNSVRIMLSALGNENAIGFTIAFNPAHVQLIDTSLGADALDVTPNINLLQISAGIVGVAMLKPDTNVFSAGDREVFKLHLVVASNAPASTVVSFVSVPVYGEVSDTRAKSLATAFQGSALPVNHPPGTEQVNVVAVRNQPVTIAETNLLLRTSDVDGDSITVASLGAASTKNGVITRTNGTITYVPPLDYVGTDSFGLQVQDGRGGNQQMPLIITVSDADKVPANRLALTLAAGGGRQMKFTGFLGLTYELQRSTDLINWTTIVTNLMPGKDGLMEPADTNSPVGNGYYRTLIKTP